MKSRVAILAMLVTGMVFSTAGAGLALQSNARTNASVAQYATPTPTPTCTATPGSDTSPASGSPAPVCSPSRAALRGEVLTQLRQTLDSLEPLDREVLALRHFEELSNHEVATILGIQTAAASKRYVRALERLRTALEQVPGFGEDRS